MPRQVCWGVLSLALLLWSGRTAAQGLDAPDGSVPEVEAPTTEEREGEGPATEAPEVEPPVHSEVPAAPYGTDQQAEQVEPEVEHEDEEAAPPLDPETRRTAMARALFLDGVTQARGGSFARAADFFRRAHALRPAPPIAYNLASALLQIGRLIEASEALQEVIRHAETAPEMRAAAQVTVARIAARLAHVRIVLTGAPGEVALTLDDRPLEAAVLGVMVPIDPGRHELAAYRGDVRVAQRDFELAEAAREEVALEIPQASRAPSLALAPEPAPASEDLSWLLWTGVGVGAALVLVVMIGVLAADGGAPQAIAGTTLPAVLEWR